MRFDSANDQPTTRKLDTIALRGLEFRCIIGLYRRERLEAQPLEMDLELYLNVDRAVFEHDLSYSVDYAALVEELGFILEHARFEMLETAAHALCYYLLGFQPADRRRARIEGVRLTLRKPKALKGAAYPELVIQRFQQDLESDVLTDGKFARALHHNANCSLFQIDLQEGEFLHFQLDDNEVAYAFPCSEGLASDQQLMAAGKSYALGAQNRIAVLSPGMKVHSLLLLVRVVGGCDRLRPVPVIHLAAGQACQLEWN
ncbi:MAG: dihydroneopterin aldolase [Oligoflexus sp.]